MSLRRALERLPHDRQSEALIRAVLSALRRHPGEWIDPARLAVVLDSAEEPIDEIMSALARSFVLDFDDESRRYRYEHDRLVELEIDQYMRAADSSAGMLQTNVEKFRRRYGGR